MLLFDGLQVLVTGGAGFIGSNLAQALTSLGATVRVLDNLSTGRLANLNGCIAEIEFVEGDIRDMDILDKAIEGVNTIFHQAALPSVPRSIADPLTTDQVNSQGTLTLLLAARDKGAKRVIYASSSSVYGDSPTLPKEEIMPTDPLSPYALSKFTGERYCRLFYSLYGLETVALRYFNVFGPRQDPTSQYSAVIPKFISSILGSKAITIYGDGEQTRDFTFVDNVVQANLQAAMSEEASGEVLNIACGKRISIIELAEFLMNALDNRVEIRYAPQREGEVRDSLASTEKARATISYDPMVDVWEGLRRTAAWYKKLD